MITRSEREARSRSRRILRIATVASVCVHLLAVVLGFGLAGALAQAVSHRTMRTVKPDDETVTLSTALHLEKRPRAAATRPHLAAAMPPVVRPRPARKPMPALALVKPEKAVAAPRRQRELAKTVPRATPLPRETQPPASAPPKVERQVAIAERKPAASAQVPSSRGALNAAQLAQIQADLAASIGRDRARENPLSNVARRVDPASTMRRFTINFAGRGATLHGAEGLCIPLRTWAAGAYVYFNVTCRTQHPDGSVRNEVIPWPLRFRPDQVSYGPDGPAPPAGQIPLPPAGWKPRAAQYIDPDVLDFLRQYGYAV